jgi:hypothetical protein
LAIDFVKLAATAERLIEENGRSVTLAKQDETPSNPAEPWRGSTTNTDTSVVIAVVVPVNAKDVDGELIRVGDMQAFVAATSDNVDGEDLEEYDQLLDGTDEWNILDVQLIQPATQRLLYVMKLRR